MKLPNATSVFRTQDNGNFTYCFRFCVLRIFQVGTITLSDWNEIVFVTDHKMGQVRVTACLHSASKAVSKLPPLGQLVPALMLYNMLTVL